MAESTSNHSRAKKEIKQRKLVYIRLSMEKMDVGGGRRRFGSGGRR